MKTVAFEKDVRAFIKWISLENKKKVFYSRKI
jgi:hypothetical protein